MKKYYKVVKQIKVDNKKKFVSVFAGKSAQVEYKIGEYIKAPEWLAKQGYHLLVFNNLEEAKIFKDSLQNIIIFECDIKDRILILPEICNYSYIKYGVQKKYPEEEKWPRSTVMAKQVKLIREVK